MIKAKRTLWIIIIICSFTLIALGTKLFGGFALTEWQKNEDMKEIRDTKYLSDFLIG